MISKFKLNYAINLRFLGRLKKSELSDSGQPKSERAVSDNNAQDAVSETSHQNEGGQWGTC